MLHTCALHAASSETGPSPTIQHGLNRRELAALQREIRVSRATIAVADARQQCRAAYDLVEASNERIMRSRQFLATSRITLGGDLDEHQPLPQD